MSKILEIKKGDTTPTGSKCLGNYDYTLDDGSVLTIPFLDPPLTKEELGISRSDLREIIEFEVNMQVTLGLNYTEYTNLIKTKLY